MKIETVEIARSVQPRERPTPENLDALYKVLPTAQQIISDQVDKHTSDRVEAGVSKAEQPSSQSEDTENTQLGINSSSGALIRPLYDPSFLTKTIEGSSELRQVVAAMVANTILYGYRLVPRLDDSKTDGASKEEMLDEEIAFENFAMYASEGSFLRVLEELAWDFYLTGNAWVEIVRNELGKITSIYRIPSYTMQLSKHEAKPHTVEIKSIRRTRDGYTIRDRIESKRFRRYAQVNRGTISIADSSTSQGIYVWFKEFQDDREYDRTTGEPLTTQRKIAAARRAGKLANEMVHISSPATRGPYGFPYYIGNLIAIAADIQIDNTNLTTLESNMIPSMVVMVSGNAALTQDSWKRISEFTRSKFVGKDNRSRFLVLEAQPMSDTPDEDNGHIRVDIKSLHETQKNDQMFGAYSESARSSIRRAFRLPEILVGRGSAQSGIVVAASMKLADEQIFSQDRQLFVDWINRRLLPEMGIAHHVVELNSPNATDPDTLVRLLQAAERTGALTPEISQLVVGRILSMKFPEWPADAASLGFRKDLPFTFTMAKAVKAVNDAGSNNPTGSNLPRDDSTQADPTVPGQSVTASPGNASGEA